MRTVIQPVLDFLKCETPNEWVSTAMENIDLLLIDHAHCEKKAASTALSLMYKYPEKTDLMLKMSRIAREELRHFEQVIAILKKRGIKYESIPAAKYAEGLRKDIRTYDPQRLVDILIIGAIIEARSCERFYRLIPHLDEELSIFYDRLLDSEARHFETYLKFAQEFSPEDISPRVEHFLSVEKGLIEGEDEQFRFHSGKVISLAPEF